MVEEKDIMEPYLTKRNKAVYELSLVLIQNNEKVLEYSKEIDAYEGEVGIRYASNLLFRLGNSAVFGLELEKIPWKELDYSKEPKNFGYIKKTESGEDSIQIMAKWYQAKIIGIIDPAQKDDLAQSGCID